MFNCFKGEVFMNCNVYLRKKIGEKVTQIAKSLRRSRNFIVNEALEEWLSKHTTTKWPKSFFDFSPIHDAPDFKSFRKDLKDNSLT